MPKNFFLFGFFVILGTITTKRYNMKKITTLLTLCALAGSASAAVERPVVVNSDFASEFETGLSWQSLGVDGTPSGDYARYFPNYSATDAYNLLSAETNVYALSPSQFSDGTASDQWLLTPEFVPEGDLVITYMPVVIGNRVKNEFKLMLVTSDDPRDGSSVELASSTIKGSGDEVFRAQRRCVLSGYEGKKVRVAYVNSGNTSGILGVQMLQVAPYYINIEDETALNTVVLDKNAPCFSISVGLTTASDTPGFKAVLRTASGYVDTFESTKVIVNSKVVKETIVFDNIDLGGRVESDYTVEITPNYEGAPTTVISGNLLIPTLKYPSPVVIEELTGTWCGYCTYGYGIMEYFSHTYNGDNGEGSAYGIAIHAGQGSNAKDPMEVTSLLNSYYPMATPLGFKGFPYMMVNRIVGQHPIDAFDGIKQILMSKNYVKGGISRVELDDAGHVKLNYFAKMTFSADNVSYRVAALVTQNKMTGTTRDWNQSNYISSITSQQVASQFGEDVVPYFSNFIDGASSSVKGLEYPDVLRQVYPSVDGELFTADYKAYENVSGVLEFDLDKNVTDVTNSVITFILIDSETGYIVGADRVAYENYNKDLAGVSAVETASELRIAGGEGRIAIDAPEAGVAEIYSVDGRLLDRVQITDGVNVINASYSGIVVVNVKAGDSSKSAKVVVK